MQAVFERLALRGPREGQTAVVSIGAGADGIIDLGMFDEDPHTIYVEIKHSGATPLFYRYTDDPAATVDPAAVSGATRVAMHGAQPERPARGCRYMVFECASAAIVRVSNVTHDGPRNVANQQMMNIFAEGDSNTALDAPAAGFAGYRGQWWWQAQKIMSELGVAAKWVRNFAVSGSQWTVPSGLAPTPVITRGASLDALTRAELFNVCICSIGTNDVNGLGDTLPTLQTNFNTWCDNRIASGVWDALVFLQCPPQTLNAGKDTILQSYDSYIQTQVGTRLQAYARLLSTVQASVVGGVRNPRFVPNVSGAIAEHYNELGAREIAVEVVRTLLTLTVPAP